MPRMKWRATAGGGNIKLFPMAIGERFGTKKSQVIQANSNGSDATTQSLTLVSFRCLRSAAISSNICPLKGNLPPYMVPRLKLDIDVLQGECFFIEPIRRQDFLEELTEPALDILRLGGSIKRSSHSEMMNRLLILARLNSSGLGDT
ncbi:hypothetical protein ACTXT7_006867 [Hymenolepis weldensis]